MLATLNKKSPKSPGDSSRARQQELRKVFRQFDLDDSGEIASDELMALGTARRALGQKQGAWTEEKNARLVANMDASGDGLVDEKEFCQYFDSKLPSDTEEFKQIMTQFMEVAKACRKKKQEARKAGGNTSASSPSLSPRSKQWEVMEADAQRAAAEKVLHTQPSG